MYIAYTTLVLTYGIPSPKYLLGVVLADSRTVPNSHFLMSSAENANFVLFFIYFIFHFITIYFIFIFIFGSKRFNKRTQNRKSKIYDFEPR